MEFEKLELNTEEKMLLADLVQSDTWRVIGRIADHHYENALKMLLSVSEGGTFHKTQGTAIGIHMIIESIRQLSRPPGRDERISAMETSLNARKPKI